MTRQYRHKQRPKPAPTQPGPVREQASDEQPRRFVFAALGVFLVALGVRLLHVWAMRDSPFFSVLVGDARGYDAWAREIASGDWIGRDVFYQAPLYPYFIGAIYTLFGADVMALRIAQAVVGSASCVLVAYAGACWFSQRVGLVAGLALALYGPAIFFDFIIQKSVLDVFFVCAALALLGHLAGLKACATDGSACATDGSACATDGSTRATRDSGRSTAESYVAQAFRPAWRPLTAGAVWAWVGLGVVIGCLGLTRENALLLVPVIAVWIWHGGGLGAWRLGGVKAWRLAGFLLGLAIALTPVAARNYAVGGGFYLTTAQFGPNFYIGNNPEADGTYMSLRFGRGSPEYERVDATELAEHALGRRLTPGEVSSYWTSRALAFITSRPGDWLRLQMRKVALLLNADEMVDTESQEAHAEHSWVLRMLLPVTHFGVLVPLAALGVVLTRRDRRRLWMLYAIALTYAASTVLFFVFARYRFPLVPILILFAAAAAVSVARMARERTWPEHSAALIASIVLIAVFTNWPMLSVDLMRAITETNVGTALYEAGRSSEAVERYRKALAIRSDYAPAYNNLGVALRAQGRVEDAIEAYEQGLRARADYPDLHFNLANALMAQDRTSEAAEHLRKAAAVAPDSAGVHNNLGKALAEKGQVADAAREFERALELEPDSIQALRNLGAVLPALGRSDEALAHLRRAVAIAPANAEAQYDLGRLCLEADRFPEAATAFRAAIAARSDYVEARNNLGIALASQGELRDAIAQWKEALRIKPDFADAQRNLDLAKRTAR